jgi:hypothetical protein
VTAIFDPTVIGTWVALGFTLFAFSGVLYKDNIAFKFAQYTYLGASVGYIIALAVKTIIDTAWTPMVNGEYAYAISIVLGLLLYARFKKGLEVYSRWGMAFLIAVGAALAIRGNLHAYFYEQIIATMLPLWTSDPLTSFNNIIMIIGVFTAMLYFILTREHKGPLKYPSRIGRVFIMLAFGAFFAGLIMTRLTLITGRIRFILETLGILAKA